MIFNSCFVKINVVLKKRSTTMNCWDECCLIARKSVDVAAAELLLMMLLPQKEFSFKSFSSSYLFKHIHIHILMLFSLGEMLYVGLLFSFKHVQKYFISANIPSLYYHEYFIKQYLIKYVQIQKSYDFSTKII